MKKPLNLTEEDIAILNSKIGLKHLLADKKLNYEKALRIARHELELRELQVQLVDLQSYVIANNKKVVILFEGRDSAGKGGAIRRITAHINPRYYRIVALTVPTEEEKGQWYFQRYINQLPKPGEIVFFDRSWYNRAVVEPVNGFCSKEDYRRFMGQVNDFERMLIESDTHLIKFYFSISKDEQAKRFRDIKNSPLKRWKMSPVDEKAQDLWDDYTHYKNLMFAKTNTELCPWIVIKADKKAEARRQAVKHLLNSIPYKENKVEPTRFNDVEG